MSAFNGRQHKGAMRERRQLKKQQAEVRNALTLPDRRRAFRRQEQAS